MFERDFDEFGTMLGAVFGLKGQTLTGEQKALWFRVLAKYPLAEVRAGLDAHITDPARGKFLPMPADVIAQIQGIVADDGRPGPEEAWALCMRGKDEAVTIVWTEEMSEAMGVSHPLMQAGDEIGARMAFKEAYTRMVESARAARRAPAWSASLGHDAAGRDAALLPHVEAGRLPKDVLSAPRIGLAEVLALPAPVGATASNLSARETALRRLAELRERYVAEPEGPSQSEIDRQRTDLLKSIARDRVDEYLQGVSA